MAITRSGVSSNSRSTTGTDASVTHTVVANTTLLVVSTMMEADQDVSGTPTWSGNGTPQNLVLIDTVGDSGSSFDTSVWTYALTNPTPEVDGTVTVTHTSNDNFITVASNYLGTNTSGTMAENIAFLNEDDNNTTLGNSISLASGGTAGNTLYAAGVFKGGDGDPISSLTANFATLYDSASGTSTSADLSAAVVDYIGGAPSACAWTWAKSDENCAHYFEIFVGSGDPNPGTDALALAGQTPVPTFQYTIEPNTGAINIWKYIGLKLQGIPPTIDVASGAIEREPGTVALTIAEQTPVRVVNDIPVPDKDTLALSGQVPITVVGEIELPGIDALALSGQAPAAIIANTREPSTVALTIGEQTPVRSVGQIRSPDTDALALSGQAPTVIHNRLADVPVGSLTIAEQTPVRSVGQIRAPDTDALALSGKVPTIQHNRLSDMPVGSLTIDEKTPVRAVGDIREPDIDALVLDGKTPTVQHNRLSDVPLGTLTLDGKVPISSNGAFRIPDQGSLALSGQVPTAVVANVVAPGIDELALSGQQVSINGFEIEVPTGAINIWKYIGLKLDGFPPTLAFDQPRTIPTGTLTFQGYQPLDQDTVVPSVGSLSLSGQDITLKGIEEPSTASLTFDSDALTVDIDTAIEPSLGTLTLSGQSITSVLPVTTDPLVGSLTLTGIAPAAGVDSSIVGVGTLSLSGSTPTATTRSYADPGKDTLAISGKTPTVDRAASPPITIEVGTASLQIFSTVLAANTSTTALAIAGQSVSIFYRDGTFIENANATTSVPSNYEQCDFSGFRQLPGSLKLTWNKHAVRKKSWEERHPQDTLQSVPERPKGSKRPEQTDKFIDTLYPDGVDVDDL